MNHFSVNPLAKAKKGIDSLTPPAEAGGNSWLPIKISINIQHIESRTIA